MSEEFNAEGEFVVKDSVGIMLFMAVFFSVLLVSSLPYNENGNLTFILVLAGGGIIFSVYKVIVRKPQIRVNRSGIYAAENLITDWDHFYTAEFQQLPLKRLRVSEKNILIVHYRKDGIEGSFRSTIPLTNTQNKSEEAVVEAVRFYHDIYRLTKKNKY